MRTKIVTLPKIQKKFDNYVVSVWPYKDTYTCIYMERVAKFNMRKRSPSSKAQGMADHIAGPF